MNTAWKQIPLRGLLADNTSPLIIERLMDARYRTAGDVLDAEPDDLARDVKGLGPVRAIKLRQRVFDRVRPPAALVGAHSAPRTLWVHLTYLGVLLALTTALVLL